MASADLKSITRVLPTLLLAGCLSAANADQGAQPRSGLPDQASFEDQGGRKYVFHFERGRAGLADSHAGVVLIDCSNNGYLCIQGDVVIAAPKTCDSSMIGDSWNVNDTIFFRRLSTNGSESYYQLIDNSGSDKGIVFDERLGIVGFWIRPNSAEYTNLESVIFRTNGNGIFGCQAE
jgi:hypothetical protein